MLILLAINVSSHEIKCVNDDHTHSDYILNKMYKHYKYYTLNIMYLKVHKFLIIMDKKPNENHENLIPLKIKQPYHIVLIHI